LKEVTSRRRNAIRFAGLAVAATLLLPQAASASSQTLASLYVSPSGSDTAAGSVNRPFRTLERARDEARKLNGRGAQDIVINLYGGTYTLDRALELTSADSGADGHTVTYRAMPGQSPVISGGRTVTGWSVYDTAHNIYRAQVGNLQTRQIYVDGVRATRARTQTPLSGFAKAGNGFTAPDASLAGWHNQSDIEVVTQIAWKLIRCPLASIAGTAVTVREPCWHNANLHTGIGMEAPTWFENAYELLDQPGEWYLDRTTGFLYYQPLPGQNLAKATVVAAALETLVHGAGTPANPIVNLRFEGLTFSYATWLAPNSAEGYADVQAGFHIVGASNPDFDATRTAWAKTPAAVSFTNDHGLTFERNVFTRLGAAGLDLGTGSQRDTVTGNRFTDISSTGIQLGGIDEVDHHPADPRQVTRDNTIANNVVTRIGAEYADAVGIFVGYTTRSSVHHNKLYHLPYSGVSIGWGFGLTDPGGNPAYPGNLSVPVYDSGTTSLDNHVYANLIYDLMTTLADGGGIYHLGASPGTVISGNYIHDIGPTGFGPIYLDEGSRLVTVTENAICRVDVRWLLINGGGARYNTALYNLTTNPEVAVQGAPNNTVVNNTTVPNCDALPASITAAAGLEAAYRDLDPSPPQSDRTTPSRPTATTATAILPTVADIAWTASGDNIGVTGYEVYADGRLVGASATTGARIGGLTPGATIAFTVRARDAAGNLSPPGAPATLTLPGAQNFALHARATSSSQYSADYSPDKAVDGNAGTRWAQGAGLPDPSWLQVDLGTVRQIKAVVTTFEKSSGYRYTVEASADDSDTPTHWTVIDDHTATATTSAVNYSLSTGVAARHLRLTITGSSGSGGSIFELQTFGEF
jgi:hypothetical protein